MHAAGGGAANHQRYFFDAEVVVLLHLSGHVLHLFQAGRDQARQADDVGALDLGARQNFVAGHHHAHVDDFKVVALQDHRDDVLADVMHVTLDGGDDDLALGLDVGTGRFEQQLFRLDVGQQMRYGLLHDAGAFDHLRQEHLALAEQVADHVHAVHQRAFNHMQRPAAVGLDGAPHLFGVFGDELVHAAHQRVRQALLHRQRAPFVFQAVVARAALGGFGHIDQSLSGVRPAVQHHVFDPFAQHRLELVVHAHHAGVDDAHVHAGLNGVVQEHGVNRLAHRVVAAKAEGHVGHAAADLGARQVGLDPARGFDEIHRVVVVLFNARGNGKNVGVKDDVFGRKTHFIDQHAVSALANLDLALVGVGLAFFVKGHDHGRCAIALEQLGLLLEGLHAFFHGDRVDDPCALDATQPRFNDAPLGAVNHDGHARDVGLAGDQVQKPDHGGLAVEHGLVHVDVDDLRAVFHLLPGDSQRLLVVPVQHHAGKRLGTGDVGALADVDEQIARANADRLQAGQLHGGNSRK